MNIKDIYNFVKSYSRILSEEKRLAAARERRAAIEKAKVKMKARNESGNGESRNQYHVKSLSNGSSKGKDSGNQLLDVLSVGSPSNFRGGARSPQNVSATNGDKGFSSQRKRPLTSPEVSFLDHFSNLSTTMKSQEGNKAEDDNSSSDSGWESM